MDSQDGQDSSPGKIAGFGIPLLDFIAEVDEGFLARYHLDSNNSTQATEDQLGLYAELVKYPGVQIVPGGAVPNALRIAQWLLGIPKVTISFGCIGDDDFGRILTTRSESEGVHVQYQVHPTVGTGSCAVLITGQNRCLCAHFAAAKQLSQEFIENPESVKLIQSASCLYVVGYFIHTYPEIARHLASIAERDGKTLVVNLSAAYVCQQSTDLMLEMIEHADIIFGNKMELQALVGALGWEECDSHAAMQKLSSIPSKSSPCKGRHIIITHGPQPTVWCQGNEMKAYEVPQVEEKKIVDTCGAGDAFVGGFLSQLVKKKGIEDCIRCGHYAAIQSIQQRGMTIVGSPDFR
ncbi:uncharacterized protein [Diadema antillarum]|uniref:uncharacterized protein n=1 Tax=Diadema antillarum TaxID=105358 RepID=UPI003A83EA40